VLTVPYAGNNTNKNRELQTAWHPEKQTPQGFPSNDGEKELKDSWIHVIPLRFGDQGRGTGEQMATGVTLL